MADPNWLLSTRAQSTAAIVAIGGGFLVSRLVQLSSEKEGLRRRLESARDELKHAEKLFAAAHEYRLQNSREAFFDWVLDDLVTREEDFNPATLLDEYIPRGSPVEEMAGYLDEIIARVDAARMNVGNYVRQDDTRDLTIEDLEQRGMIVPQEDRVIYDSIESNVLDELPERTYNAGAFGMITNPMPFVRLPQIDSPAITTTELRRLDESIREEQDLLSRRSMLDAGIARLVAAIEQIGKPVGVTAAVSILGIYSVLGILAPVAVMAFLPLNIVTWLTWTLVSMFTAGLAMVVIYVYWYAKSLNGDRTRVNVSRDGRDAATGGRP